MSSKRSREKHRLKRLWAREFEAAFASRLADWLVGKPGRTYHEFPPDTDQGVWAIRLIEEAETEDVIVHAEAQGPDRSRAIAAALAAWADLPD